MSTATSARFTLESVEEAAAFYREHGYALIGGVFSPEEIARAHAATDRLKAGVVDGSVSTRGNLTAIRDRESGGARACYWGSHLEPTLDALRTDTRMLEILRPLIGENLRQLTNHLHWKPPGSTIAVNFHTDRINRKPDEDFRDLGASFVQTAIAIDPMTSDNGPLLVVPGSHRRVTELQDRSGSNYANGQPGRDILTEAGYAAGDLVPVLAEAGDVALWHPDTIHGSDVNRSTIDRCIYINGYIAARSTWRGHWAFVRGRAVPLPPLDVPVPVGRHIDLDRWVEQFPIGE